MCVFIHYIIRHLVDIFSSLSCCYALCVGNVTKRIARAKEIIFSRARKAKEIFILIAQTTHTHTNTYVDI